MATIPKVPKKKVAVEEVVEVKCPITAKDNEIVLGVLDTYHDFCKSERITASARKKRAESEASSTSGSSENEDESDETRIEVMREYLPKLLQHLYPSKGFTAKYQENINTLTCGTVSSVSAIEHKAVEMFETSVQFRDVLNAAPECKEFLTFQQIIDAYKQPATKASLLNKYKLGTQNRILELSRSGRRFGKNKADEAAEKQEIESLSDFILHYFFNTSDADVYMTFDAGERIVGDIFHNRTNVKCVIFPETLADSATTSFAMLDGRNEYVFPSSTTEILFKSNLFSEEKYSIKIQYSGFSQENPYGFTLIIQSKETPTVALELPFSPKQSQGPSVNYLIDVLKTARDNGALRKDYESKKKKSTKALKAPEYSTYEAISRKGTILNIGKALDENEAFRLKFENDAGDEINGIIPDLKRCGDHEAVLASRDIQLLSAKYKYFIFCTIDILCGLKSRLEENNTIWQGNDKIILYRYEKVSPQEAANNKYRKMGKEIYDLLTKINTFMHTTLRAGLTAQLAKFEKGKTAVVNYADRTKEPFYKLKCEEMLNALLRIAMLDLSEYCELLLTKGSEFESVDFSRIEVLAKAFQPFYGEAATIDTLLSIDTEKGGILTIPKTTTEADIYVLDTVKTEVLEYYTIITNKVKEYLNLDINIGQETEKIEGPFVMRNFQLEKDVTDQRLDISDPKGEATDTVFKLEEHSVFGYIPAVFEKLYDHLMFLHDLSYKNTLKPSREYDKILKKILSNDPTAPFNFFKTVDDILSQFKNKEYATAISDILNIKTAAEAAKTTVDDRFTEMKLYLLGEVILFDEATFSALSTLDQQPYFDRKRRQNGIVINIANYYKELQEKSGKFLSGLATLSYEPPVQTAGMRGGNPPKFSIYQYYDLNNILYRISSQAATFIESAYCDEYPAYQLLHMFTSINQTEAISSVQFKFQDVVKKIYVFLEDDSRYKKADGYRGSVLTKDTVKGHLGVLKRKLTSIFDKAKDIIESSEKLTEIFLLLCKSDGTTIEYPSIKEFLQTLSSNDYIIHNDEFNLKEVQRLSLLNDPSAENIKRLGTLMADEILVGTQTSEELDALWQEGIYEIRQDKDYIYEFDNDRRGFSSEELISYLLTLGVYSQGGPEYTVTGILEGYDIPITNTNPENKRYDIYSYLGDSVFFFADKTARNLQKSVLVKELQGIKDLVNVVKTPGYDIDVKTTILFLFTLLENVMNKTEKKSFFLTGAFTKTQFEAKAYWRENLYRLLTHLLQTLSLIIPTAASKIDLVRRTYLSGGTYPKKTRKHAARKGSRKSKKYNRTRRVR